MTREPDALHDAPVVLAARGLRKRWPGGGRALAGASIEVRRGEVVALVGANGSGKSTLLLALAALESVDDGEVLLDGSPAAIGRHAARGRARDAALRAHRAEMGVVFPSYDLFPHLTVGGNCMAGPRFGRGLPRAECERRAREALARTGMSDTFARRPDELSGGQRQRVAIARALANAPRVLLLDEPTAALDPARRAEVSALVRSLAREAGTTMIVVTHDLAFVDETADRVALMDEGTVIAQCAPRELVAREDPRVRAFLAGGQGGGACA
jgi:ABC-type polar amino acid transport system ATPase subunit